MHKLIPFLLCIALMIYSCTDKKVKPDNVVLKSTITATVDGIDEDFSAKDSVYNYGTEGFDVIGANKTGSVTDHIEIIFTHAGGLVPGTYSYPATDSASSLQLRFVSAGADKSDYYYTYHTNAGPGYINFNNPGTLTITSVSNTTVQGTFSGSLVWSKSVPNGPIRSKTVTNGKFNLILR